MRQPSVHPSVLLPNQFSPSLITRDLLLFLAHRRSIDRADYHRELTAHVLPDGSRWRKFLRVALLAAGAITLTSGVLFLLAFNWEELGSTWKITLAALAVVIPAMLSVSDLVSLTARKTLLTTAAVFVGGLLAVVGQVYHTGVDNLSYFVAWWGFITLWAWLIDFPALWLLWLAVGNLAIYFSGEGPLAAMRDFGLYGLQTAFSGLCLLAFIAFSRVRRTAYPKWFPNSLVVLVSGLAFTALFATTWEQPTGWSVYLIRIGVVLLLLTGIVIGYLRQWLGLVCAFALSFSACVANLIAVFSGEAGIYFAAAWVLASITATGLIANILRREWRAVAVIKEATIAPDAGARSGGEEQGTGVRYPIFRRDAHLEGEWNAAREAMPTPAIHFLNLFGGIAIAGALISVLALLGAFDSQLTQLGLGGGLMAIGIFLDRTGRQLFLDAFQVAVSFTGALLLFSALQHALPADLFSAPVAGLSVCASALLIYRNREVALLAVIGWHGSVVALLFEADVETSLPFYLIAIAAGLTWWVLSEHRIVTASPWLAKRFRAVRAGTAVVLLAATAIPRWSTLISDGPYFGGWSSLWLLTSLVPVIAWVVFTALRQAGSFHWGLVPAVIALLLPVFFAPAAAPALLIIVLSARTNYRFGIVLGTLGLLYFISQYYYDLNLSLLTKSIVLLLAGTGYLIAYAALRYQLPARVVPE